MNTVSAVAMLPDMVRMKLLIPTPTRDRSAGLPTTGWRSAAGRKTQGPGPEGIAGVANWLNEAVSLRVAVQKNCEAEHAEGEARRQTQIQPVHIAAHDGSRHQGQQSHRSDGHPAHVAVYPTVVLQPEGKYDVDAGQGKVRNADYQGGPRGNYAA